MRTIAQNEVGALPLGNLHGQSEALGILGIGGDHSGEIPVDDHLLRHADHVLHAQTAQSLGDELVAGAVEGGVHHLEGVGHSVHSSLVVDLLHDVGQELLVGLGAHQGDAALVQSFLVVHGLDAVEHVQLLHLGGHLVGGAGRQLGTVRPVHLVAVVLLGVVAGGDVDAGDAAVLPDGKGQLGSGAQRVEQAHGNAVGSHDTGGLTGEELGVVAAVVAHSHSLGGGLGALLQNHLGKRLGGVAHHMYIHPVQAHPHGAPETGGAKAELGEKAGFHFLLVPGNGGQLRLLLLGQGRTLHPALILCLVIHGTVPPYILNVV